MAGEARRVGGAYLLRVRSEPVPLGGSASPMRFSVEELNTRRRRGFSDMEELLGFVRRLAAEQTDAAEGSEDQEVSP